MTLPFSVRLRAHSAGLEDVVERLMGSQRSAPPSAADLLALARGPLPLLGAVAASSTPREAAVVGLLPVEIVAGLDAEVIAKKALAHRAAAEAEVVELRAEAGAPLAVACEVIRTLLASLRGTSARIDEDSLRALASGAGISAEEAAVQLAEAGLGLVTRRCEVPGAGSSSVGPIAVRESCVVPESIDEGWISTLLAAAPAGALALVAGPATTGILLLRASALARIAGFSSISVGGGDELKGPDGCLAFGVDRLEAELDPPGTMGSRTRAYGEAAIQGAQLSVKAPVRRATANKKIAHILDEVVDPSLLPGGDPAHEAAAQPGTLQQLEVRS